MRYELTPKGEEWLKELEAMSEETRLAWPDAPEYDPDNPSARIQFFYDLAAARWDERTKHEDIAAMLNRLPFEPHGDLADFVRAVERSIEEGKTAKEYRRYIYRSLLGPICGRLGFYDLIERCTGRRPTRESWGR